MKYAVVTFGCRVNQADSMRLEGELSAAGGEPTDCTSADVVIVNTCSVTATADQGNRQTIRRIARTNPSARIVATGCYATRCASEVAALPGVVHVVGNDDKDDLLELLGTELGLTTAGRFGVGDGACGAPATLGLGGRTAFTLRLQTGCDEACTYCIIPTTRGRPRSLPVNDALATVRRAIEAGFKEIVLTGVHLGSYGRDLDPSISLVSLLRRLADEAGDRDVLFRLSSIEPMDCGYDVVDLVAAHRCFAPHFHLPLQHGSDAMLAKMRRPYSSARYARLVDRIRRLVPQASIGSDLIAGFPGESDADFARTLRYVASSPLTYLHVFPYSSRPGTVASELADKVEPTTIRDRARQLRAVGRQLSARFRADQAGCVRRALTLDDRGSLVTDNYLKLRISHDRGRNQRVWVRLEDGGNGDLTGELVG